MTSTSVNAMANAVQNLDLNNDQTAAPVSTTEAEKVPDPNDGYPCKCYKDLPLNFADVKRGRCEPTPRLQLEIDLRDAIEANVPKNASEQKQASLLSKVPKEKPEIRREIYRYYLQKEEIGPVHCTGCGEDLKEVDSKGNPQFFLASAEFRKGFSKSRRDASAVYPLLLTCRQLYDELRPLMLPDLKLNIKPDQVIHLGSELERVYNAFISHRGYPLNVRPVLPKLTILFSDRDSVTKNATPTTARRDMWAFFIDLYSSTQSIEAKIKPSPDILDLRILIDFEDVLTLSHMVPLLRGVERLPVTGVASAYLSTMLAPGEKWCMELAECHGYLMETVCNYALQTPGLPDPPNYASFFFINEEDQHASFRRRSCNRAIQYLAAFGMPDSTMREIPGVFLVFDPPEDELLGLGLDLEMAEIQTSFERDTLLPLFRAGRLSDAYMRAWRMSMLSTFSDSDA